MDSVWNTNRLSSGDLELVILPGIGGRLWDVVFAGHSLLFQNPDLIGSDPDLEDLSQLPTRSPQFGFPLWGGEKTWIAPDQSWINGAPHPVLDSGPYQITELGQNDVSLLSEICPLSGLQVRRRIAVNSSESWSIQHEVKNCGTADRLTGIWSVLMLDRPTRIGLQIGNEGTAKTVFGDAGDLFVLHGANAIFKCNRAREFKIGVNNPMGKVFAMLGEPESGVWLDCATALPSVHDQFAHGHNFEVFNSDDYAYCEAEWHAPARDLKPGESVSFDQHFQVRSSSDQLSGDDLTLGEQELLTCMCS